MIRPGLKLTIHMTTSLTVRLTVRTSLRLNMGLTLRPDLRHYLRPKECFKKIPLPWLASDDARYKDRFGASVSVFEVWVILGDPFYDN